MEMKKYKLSEILTIKNGKDHKELKSGIYPVYGSGGIMRHVDTFLYDKPSILLPRKGTLDNIQYSDKPFWTVDTIYYTEVNFDLANPFYLYNFIKLLDLSNLDSGTGVPSMTFDSYYNLSVNLPSLPTQQKIAAVLSSLDDKIALNKKINAKLEAMANRLYDYWFVQFDFPDKNGKPYKTSGGKMVWNEVLKRKIPEGWEVVQIKKFFENEIPGDWGEEQPKKNNTYQVSCIRGCDMVTMNDLPIRYILPSNATKLLKPNDFIIEISGGSPTQSTGRIVQITEEIINRFNGNVICSNFCHGVRILNKKYISYFLRMWNMFYDNKVFFNYEGKTSGLKNFQFDTFVENKWYMPPEDIVKKYDLTVNKIKAKIDKNESENLKLTAMRDRLLPLLMNGQVEVK